MKTKQNNDKKKGTTSQRTCKENIKGGHSIEIVFLSSASREPSDTLPGSSPCPQPHIIYNNSVLSGFQVSLSTQSTSLRESLDWSNQRGSKTSQACYSHPRCNLNLEEYVFDWLIDWMNSHIISWWCQKSSLWQQDGRKMHNILSLYKY